MSYFVWSSGLETWEPVILTEEEKLSLVHLHTKTIGKYTVIILKDNLCRFILFRKNDE